MATTTAEDLQTEMCFKFFVKLLGLGTSKPKNVAKKVRLLVQSLINDTLETEEFCDRIECLMESSPQLRLMSFLKSNLPRLRQALYTKKYTLKGITPPPVEIVDMVEQAEVEMVEQEAVEMMEWKTESAATIACGEAAKAQTLTTQTSPTASIKSMSSVGSKNCEGPSRARQLSFEYNVDHAMPPKPNVTLPPLDNTATSTSASNVDFFERSISEMLDSLLTDYDESSSLAQDCLKGKKTEMSNTVTKAEATNVNTTLEQTCKLGIVTPSPLPSIVMSNILQKSAHKSAAIPVSPVPNANKPIGFSTLIPLEQPTSSYKWIGEWCKKKSNLNFPLSSSNKVSSSLRTVTSGTLMSESNLLPIEADWHTKISKCSLENTPTETIVVSAMTDLHLNPQIEGNQNQIVGHVDALASALVEDVIIVTPSTSSLPNLQQPEPIVEHIILEDEDCIAEIADVELPFPEYREFLNLNSLKLRIEAKIRQYGLTESCAEAEMLISMACRERFKQIIAKLSVIAEHRTDNIKLDPRYEVVQDIRGQLQFFIDIDQAEEARKREMVLQAASAGSKSKDCDVIKIKALAKELNRNHVEAVRQEDALSTMKLALGPRKKKAKLETETKEKSVNRASQLRTRIKRIKTEDLHFYMAQEPEFARSMTLYTAYLK